jgi:thiol-disulfide isomerase/thioredoxin
MRFFEGSLEEALQQAQKEHKLIFIDAYAVWCGPCKVMARDVFTQKEVGEFYNKNFINLKIDMEKGNGPQLAQKYQVTAYPTFLFVNEKGELVHVGRGSQPADQFVQLGKAALQLNDRSADLGKKYEEGERSPELLRSYALALLQSSKPHGKITNEFLRTNPDFSQESNLSFLFEATTESDSKIFDLLLQHQKALIGLKGDSAVQEKIRGACELSIKKAVEYQTPKLWQEAKAKYQKAYPKEGAAFAPWADALYYQAAQNWPAWAKATDQWLKKSQSKNQAAWFDRANFANQNLQDAKALALALTWAEKAAKMQKSKKNYVLYADLLDKNKKVPEAKKIRQEAERM